MRTKITLLIAFAMLSFTMMAQYKVTGTVKDADGMPLPGVSVKVKGGTNGTTTDFDGLYSLNVTKGNVLEYSSVGFESVSKKMDGSAKVDVTMAAGLSLDEVVITGNRAKPRTVLNSPVPIDNISAVELQKSGKVQVEQMLTYKVPSFNSQTQAISDATAHFDPADLRGLGPSRTLVLINGKRKNQSAQIYLNGTPGKGEVGIDLKSFPNNAVKNIEVLRDGASAQYGSDAIAGVINIILKDKTEFSEINSMAGITKAGDGFKFGFDANTTYPLGDGTINLSFEHYNQSITNRAGKPGLRDVPGAPQEFKDGDPLDPNYVLMDDNGTPNDDSDDFKVINDGGTPADLTDDYYESDNAKYLEKLAYYNDHIDSWTNWAKDNPDMGMVVGQPNLIKNSVLANITYPLGDKSEFYTFHTFTKRKGQSFAYYRAPYWRGDVQDSEFLSAKSDFVGYHPTFETEVLDNMNVAGFKFDLFGFNTDLSATYGRNYVDYTVNRSLNRDYLADNGTSPRTFHPGGYSFSNVITNLDFSKVFNDNISTSFGFEYKKEYYKGHKGDELSFYGGGSDSFAGIKPAEAIDVNRSNFAAYFGLDYDFNKDFLIGGAMRYEDFSDFGSNFSWKLNARYKLTDDIALRASTSTGFRAPTLHQRYIQLTQYIIVSPNPDPQLQGTLPNSSPAIKNLGVPSLKAETSQNFSIGATGKIGKLNLTADFYQIGIKDRVLFSSQISPIDGTLDGVRKERMAGTRIYYNTIGPDPVEQILIDNDVLAVQFFINAVNTKTTGVDLVADYGGIALGEGKFGVNLAMNFNTTVIDGKVANPKVLEDNGYDIFNHREEMRITSSRPKSKIAFGLNYDISKFNFALNNTRFGEVIVASEDGLNDQTLAAKVVTDFVFGYDFSEKFSVGFTANNIFDVYPDILWDGTNGNPDLRSAGGRFLYSSEVSQMGQLGANYSLKFKLKF